METQDSELSILETIYHSQKREEDVKQRELARIASLSLGMTNTLLKRFTEKGWITIRRINPRNIQYIITPDGVKEIATRTFRYFKRTITNVSIYKDLVEGLISSKKREGYAGVLLTGPSDLEFIVEYACQKYELFFMKSADNHTARKRPLTGRFLYLVSENEPRSAHAPAEADTAYLAEVFSR
jgi:DNA-binding MarR family transcriptional regulator